MRCADSNSRLHVQATDSRAKAQCLEDVLKLLLNSLQTCFRSCTRVHRRTCKVSYS